MNNYYYLIGVIAVFVIGFAFLKVSNSDKNYIDSQGNVVKVDISTFPQKYTSEIYKYSN